MTGLIAALPHTYVNSNKPHPGITQLYRLSADGDATCMTQKEGPTWTW